MGSDLSVVNSARVSFSKKSALGPDGLKEEDKRLIKYLAREEHFSPFNHTFVTMHVKAPIFVARQLVKHEYMPLNEVSRRYVDFTPEVYEPEWRSRPEKSIKQGSGGPIQLEDDVFSAAVLEALRAYESLLEQGVSPEQARAVLPLGSMTEWSWSGTLGAWYKMYRLRTHPTAQDESTEVALKAGSILENLYPVSWSALNDF